MAKCQFELAWKGACGVEVVEGQKFCEKHAATMCVCCGAPAVRQCHETFGLVCGAPLCATCEHRIAPDGTNGADMQHVRQGEQLFKSWLEQSEEEQIQGSYLTYLERLYAADHFLQRLPMPPASELDNDSYHEFRRRIERLKELRDACAAENPTILPVDHPDLKFNQYK